MSEAVQIYHQPNSVKLKTVDHEVLPKGVYPSFSDWLFVKAYVVISLILMGFLVWKFISLFS